MLRLSRWSLWTTFAAGALAIFWLGSGCGRTLLRPGGVGVGGEPVGGSGGSGATGGTGGVGGAPLACGDGSCANGEDCSNCPEDCGLCRG